MNKIEKLGKDLDELYEQTWLKNLQLKREKTIQIELTEAQKRAVDACKKVMVNYSGLEYTVVDFEVKNFDYFVEVKATTIFRGKRHPFLDKRFQIFIGKRGGIRNFCVASLSNYKERRNFTRMFWFHYYHDREA